MQERLLSDIRIWGPGGNYPVGVGFLVGPRHIATCAHVVAFAMGNLHLAESATPPGGEVVVDFPACASLERIETRKGVVHTWRARGMDPAPDDVAIMELSTPAPAQARPIFACAAAQSGDRFEAFAVREGMDKPTVVSGIYQGLALPHRGVISAEIEDLAVRRGCSGGAAWNLTRGGVIGMVVEGQQLLTGLLIPIVPLLALCAQATGTMIALNAKGAPGRPAASWIFDEELDLPARLRALSAIQPGRGVDPFEVGYAIIRAFADGTTEINATFVIGEACGLVLNISPMSPSERHKFVLAPSGLPTPEGGRERYWAVAFSQACMLGPRMVAALLLAAPPSVLDRARAEIAELYAKLEAQV